MLKTTAIQLLGGTPKDAAAAMGYRSAHAVYLWPEVLPQSVSDKVNGALLRIKGQTFDQHLNPIAGGATHQKRA